MKKILTVILCFVMLALMVFTVSCGGGNKQKEKTEVEIKLEEAGFDVFRVEDLTAYFEQYGSAGLETEHITDVYVVSTTGPLKLEPVKLSDTVDETISGQPSREYQPSVELKTAIIFVFDSNSNAKVAVGAAEQARNSNHEIYSIYNTYVVVGTEEMRTAIINELLVYIKF